jgi:osmotically-inducible protein OsmY
VRPIAAALIGSVLLASSLPLAGCGGTPRRVVVDQTLDDARLTARVKTALLNDAHLGSLPIDVAVQDAIVTLSGTVPGEADVTQAVELVRKVEGVADVRSRLQVGGGARRSTKDEVRGTK